LLKTPHDYWSYARHCMVWAEEVNNEARRQTLINMASAWIELGLEEGLGSTTESPVINHAVERRECRIGPIAAGIPAILSITKGLRVRISATLSSVFSQLKSAARN